MSFAIVRTALETKILTWANGKTPKVPVAMQNAAFTKPTSGLWVEVFVMPSTNLARNVGATQYRMLGVLQVNVWCPKGNGLYAAEAMAEEIKSLFPIVPKGTVSIEQIPTIGRSLSDDSGWTIIPIVIPYRYEV